MKARETKNDDWQHGVPCFAVTEWELTDFHGNGKMCKVEKPTGGYQLQWGLFERIEQAMTQKRSAKTVRVLGFRNAFHWAPTRSNQWILDVPSDQFQFQRGALQVAQVNPPVTYHDGWSCAWYNCVHSSWTSIHPNQALTHHPSPPPPNPHSSPRSPTHSTSTSWFQKAWQCSPTLTANRERST